MAVPTKTALEEHPRAVVTLFYDVKDRSNVNSLDFEWFESEAAAVEWFDSEVGENRADWDKYQDTGFVIAYISDTRTMTVQTVVAVGFDEEWQKQVVAAVNASPVAMLVAPEAKPRTPRKSTAKPKAKVRPRAASAAADVVKGKVEATSATPVVKSKTVRAKTSASPEAHSPAPVAAAGADKRAEALKKRLAAKKAETTAVVQPSMGLVRMKARMARR